MQYYAVNVEGIMISRSNLKDINDPDKKDKGNYKEDSNTSQGTKDSQ